MSDKPMNIASTLCTLYPDTRPKMHGWAPGSYFRKCVYCSVDFLGDKRAVTCSDCAYRHSDFDENMEDYLQGKRPPHRSIYPDVLWMDLSGTTNELSRRTGVPVGSVGKWLRRWQDDGSVCRQTRFMAAVATPGFISRRPKNEADLHPAKERVFRSFSVWAQASRTAPLWAKVE